MKTEIIKRKTSYPQIGFELVFVKVKGVNSDSRISWRIFLFRFVSIVLFDLYLLVVGAEKRLYLPQICFY